MKKRIVNKGPKKRAINPRNLSESLGAEETGIKTDNPGGPVSLLALRDFLAKRLESSGGRPKLRGTSKASTKVPCFESDLEKIDRIREHLRQNEGLNVSRGQITASLIHTGLNSLDFNVE